MALGTHHYLLLAVRKPYATEFLIEVSGNEHKVNKYQVSTYGPQAS